MPYQKTIPNTKGPMGKYENNTWHCKKKDFFHV